jgi:hypothetical protein
MMIMMSKRAFGGDAIGSQPMILLRLFCVSIASRPTVKTSKNPIYAVEDMRGRMMMLNFKGGAIAGMTALSEIGSESTMETRKSLTCPVGDTRTMMMPIFDGGGGASSQMTVLRLFSVVIAGKNSIHPEEEGGAVTASQLTLN